MASLFRFTGLLRYARCIVLLLLPACVARKGMAQAHPEPVRVLNIKDGLPQSYITGLAQDSTGFIWIATKDGLARYDGRKMKLYQHVTGNVATLANNVIMHLTLDREQRLWIQYDQGDIDILNTRTEGIYHFSADPVYKEVAARHSHNNIFQEDGSGNFWAVGEGPEFWRCNLQQHRLQHFTWQQLGFGTPGIGGFKVMGDTLWVNTQQGLYLADTRSKQPAMAAANIPGVGALAAKCGYITACNRGMGTELLMAGDTGILWYRPGTRTARFYPDTAYHYIYVGPSATCLAGTIYLSVDDCIFSLSTQGLLTLWRVHTPYHDAISIMGDKGGMLWVGGNATGIQQYDLRLKRMQGVPYREKFKPDVFKRELGVPEAELKKLTALTDDYAFRWTAGYNGRLWLPTGVQVDNPVPVLPYYQGGHLTVPRWHYTDTNTARHGLVCAIAVIDSNTLIGVDGALHLSRFNLQTLGVSTTPAIPVLPGRRLKAVNTLLQDGNDTLWISTDGAGLIRYIPSTRQVRYYWNDGSISGQPLTCMIQDRQHKDYLWIGSLGAGLVRLQKSTGAISTFTTTNGLPNNTVYAVLQDDAGRLWCSSNRGIFAYSPATGAIRSYTMQDGLADDEFNRYHFLQLPDGRMLFGGVNGYVVFNPENMATDSFQPAVALTGISISNRSANFRDSSSPLKAPLNSLSEIVLSPQQNFLSFEFAALEYNLPEKIQYRYMLEGLDEQWVDAGTRTIANYTNIPPGDYRLKIMATNTAGIWSPKVKVLRIVILPPFWRTWWFAMLIFLAIAAIVYLLFRRRVYVVKKEAQQRIAVERMTMELESEALRSQMNPHFIFNCLNSIKALIQDNEGTQAVSYLTTFAKLIRTQLNNDLREVSLYKELETCRLYAHMESLRFKDKVTVRITVDPDVDWHRIKVPPLLLQPLIENAIWHGILPKSEVGNVAVLVKEQEGNIVCTVDDDGIGRREAAKVRPAKNATHESKGLALVRKRLEVYSQLQHQPVTFEVIDKEDINGNPTGTLIVITFKRKQNDRPDY